MRLIEAVIVFIFGALVGITLMALMVANHEE